LRRPAKLAHSKTESGPTQRSRLSASTRRARPHPAGAHGARGTAGLPRGRRRPRCTEKSTLSTSTPTCTHRAPTRWRGARKTTGVGSGYGSPAARWFYGIRCFPRFWYGGEKTGGVGHSHQRSGERSGGMAVPSSSR
jgi:hypothetical protein